MKPSKQLAQLLSLLVVLAMLAGCGAEPTATSVPAANTSSGGQATPTTSAAPVKLTFHRFFGECADQYTGVTDLAKGEGECGVIQVLTNKWNAEHPEAQLEITVTDFGAHYTNLSAEIAAGEAPDIVVMHGAQIPNYASRGALMPLDDLLASAGVDTSDFLPAARDHASYNGKLYALPWDIHSIVWHINVDLFQQAGLVDEQGNPKLPQNRDEFMAAAKQMKEKTGKSFLAAQTNGDIGGHWAVESMIWQQGGELFTSDVMTATIKTPEALNAVDFFGDLFEAGYAGNNDDYGSAQTKWLNGEAATMINGTWSIGDYNQQVLDGKTAFKTYYVAPFPTVFDQPAVWSNSHTWAMPMQANPDPAKLEAAGRFLKYLNDNEVQWTRTGHLTVRQSVLQSTEFTDLPHRSEYGETARIARAYPRIKQVDAFTAIMHDEISTLR